VVAVELFALSDGSREQAAKETELPIEREALRVFCPLNWWFLVC
jgi:hypothetical protein